MDGGWVREGRETRVVAEVQCVLVSEMLAVICNSATTFPRTATTLIYAALNGLTGVGRGTVRWKNAGFERLAESVCWCVLKTGTAMEHAGTVDDARQHVRSHVHWTCKQFAYE